MLDRVHAGREGVHICTCTYVVPMLRLDVWNSAKAMAVGTRMDGGDGYMYIE